MKTNFLFVVFGVGRNLLKATSQQPKDVRLHHDSLPSHEHIAIRLFVVAFNVSCVVLELTSSDSL